MLVMLTGAIAFYVAWNLGANDVANSMGTSVGSGAISLRQALLVAGVLELGGAVFFGRRVSATLTASVVNPDLFVDAVPVFSLGMVVVLLTCGVWLQVATSLGLPVASSHATVAAIAGFGWAVAGVAAVNWNLLGIISVTWVFTPLVSGAIAAVIYRLIQRWILHNSQPIQVVAEWIPWLSVTVISVFGVIVLPSVISPLEPLGLPLPAHDIALSIGAIATLSLTLWTMRSWVHLTNQQLINQPLPPAANELVERIMARFQIVSACFVAFAHGSNDVGNAIAPLAAIATIERTGVIPTGEADIPLWVLVLGGLGIVGGLAAWGKNVIATIGEGIIALQPSGGFCAELATATTILLASRAGLPVSTSHALVGAVVGVGLVQGMEKVQLKTVQRIALAWLGTVPLCAGLSASLVRSSLWLLQMT